jgi:hypothetical protein
MACVTPAKNTLTVAENRNAANIHATRALEQESKYEPGRVLQPRISPNDTAFMPEFSYNPTQAHQLAADAELRAAGEHLRAAKKLEIFEDAACRDLPPGERASCPLLGSSVTQVQHTARGFQLLMKPGVDVAATNARLNCHLAYARATGFDRPSCPLFVKGITIRRVGDAQLAFEGESKEVAIELQNQARRIFGDRDQPVTGL